MSLIAEFRLRDSRLPLVDTVVAAPRATLKVDRMLTTDPDHPVVICWVEAASFESFEAELAKDTTVATHSVLETAPEQRFYHVQLQKPRLFPLKTAFVELGVVPDGRTTITDKGWDIRAHVPNRDALTSFRDTCREYGVSFRLERLYEPTSEDRDFSGLTAKQREALMIAYESGYFHIPRQASLGDLSEQLGISKPSFSNRLRRAQQHVLSSVVESGSI